jgi:predicted transcriptional regulator
VPAGTLHLAFRAGRWGSLYLEADALSWSAAGGALLVPSEAGDAPGRFLQDVFPAGTVRPALAVPAAGVAAAFRPDPQAPLSLRAEGVRRAEWHNATVSCSAGLAPCPDGAGTATLAAAPSSPAGGFSLSAASFANLLPGGSAGGRLAGSGAAFLWAAGGPALDLAVDGQVRLPAAILAGSCAACGQEARTFRAAGELTLAPLGRDPSGSGRLQARLGGAVAAAALDETALPFPAAAGAAALGAIALAAVAVKLVLVLAARRRASARDHPRRRALLELILESPGLTLREIQRRTGWGNGATRHHLDKLRRGNHIVAHADGNTVRHFENHGRFDRTWRQVVRERDPELGPLLEWLRLHPGSSQVRVQEAAAAWGWSRSGTQRRLASLQRSGLVTAARSGRSLAYTAAPMSGTGGQGPAAASAQA